MDFEKNRIKSQFIHQFKCPCSNHRWWGSSAKNKCNNCKSTVEPLDLKKTIGIGWFQCKCGRRYAGFCQGSVSSKCHTCQTENFALFIVPGDKADKEENASIEKNAHYCAACHGNGDCPIVIKCKNYANNSKSSRKSFFSKKFW